MADNQELKLQAGAETAEQPKRRGRPAKAAKPQGVAPEVAVGEDTVDYRHSAKRKNNPLAGLAAQNRAAEPPKITYAYNPHLPPSLCFDATGEADKIQELLGQAQKRALNGDEVKALQVAFSHQQPWLEWSGKREKKGFQVDPVALHIHERVSTHAILHAVQRQDIQRSLFADPEMDAKSVVEFYKYDVDWANRLILGDSLQVMASLARRENLSGQIQMIFMDPPYGIKYSSNFQAEIGNRDVKDKNESLSREPEMVKAYRDTWTLGVHSYLAYLKDRMMLCKELLTDEGSIFIQISDDNIHRVRNLLDEVFGNENYMATISFSKTTGLEASKRLSSANDYLLWYAKNSKKVVYIPIFENKIDPAQSGFNNAELPDGSKIPAASLETISDEIKLYMAGDLTKPGPGSKYEIDYCGKKFNSGKRWWGTTPEAMERLKRVERLTISGDTLRYKRYLSDFNSKAINNVWMGFGGAINPIYVVQTNTEIVKRCMLMTTRPGDLVLDPTCGSGTTAYVAESWGRRWITCDSSRVALALARQRLMTSKFEYYQLNDPIVGPSSNLKYHSIPHVTLKKIVQNQGLDPLLAKHETILDIKLSNLNTSLKSISTKLREDLKSKLHTKERIKGKRSISEADTRRWVLPTSHWEHWTVPFDTDPEWPETLKISLEDYRAAWRCKMVEVNACIDANAEQEELVDQPVVVKGITRVAGPFTVEAVMPPVESMGLESETPIGGAPDEPLDTFGAGLGVEPQNAAAFQDQVLGLLRTGGVDFLGNKHVNFTRLDALQGSVLHAEGEWTLPDGTQRRVAVSIGPRVGNVSDFQVEKALRQANLKGYQDLLFTGFGFDGVAQAVIQENAEEMEGAQTHLFLIRPDVVMGDLLKNTAASQLFTAMGLPRTKLERLPNEEFAVHMDGVDIYDPVTNALIPTGADKVAAWFVDSDYDGRCFCITQAFFPDKSAWEKLAKALKSTVDEARMEAFSGTCSLPFKAGKHQRVAVKVIDPRGNEVMAVHRLV